MRKMTCFQILSVAVCFSATASVSGGVDLGKLSYQNNVVQLAQNATSTNQTKSFISDYHRLTGSVIIASDNVEPHSSVVSLEVNGIVEAFGQCVTAAGLRKESVDPFIDCLTFAIIDQCAETQVYSSCIMALADKTEAMANELLADKPRSADTEEIVAEVLRKREVCLREFQGTSFSQCKLTAEAEYYEHILVLFGEL